MVKAEIKSLFRNLGEYADKTVTVSGWIRTVRDSKSFGFIELNDGTFFKSVQVVYEADVLENYTEISKAPIAAALMEKKPKPATKAEDIKAASAGYTQETLYKLSVSKLRDVARKLQVDNMTKKDIQFAKKQELVKKILDFLSRNGMQ